MEASNINHYLCAIYSIALECRINCRGNIPEMLSDAMDSLAICINRECKNEFTRIYAMLRMSVIHMETMPLLADWVDGVLEEVEQ